jgi:hypothetical protein
MFVNACKELRDSFFCSLEGVLFPAEVEVDMEERR